MGLLDKFKSAFSSGQAKKRLDISKRFEMNRHAFHGTMSKFHVVKDIHTNEVFGIKLLDDEKTRLFRERFKGLNAPTEGEIGTEIDHPLIAKTIEYGKTTRGQEYILMEWIDGPGMNVLIKNQDEAFRPHRLTLIRKNLTLIRKNSTLFRQEYCTVDVGRLRRAWMPPWWSDG